MVLLFASSPVLGQAGITPLELLDKIHESRAALPPFVTSVEIFVDTVYEDSSKPPRHQIVSEEYRTDGKNEELLQQWLRMEDGEKELRQDSRMFMDGNSYVATDIRVGEFSGLPPLYAVYSTEESQISTMATRRWGTNIGEIFQGVDKRPFYEGLKDSPNLRVSETMEEIDGFPCYLIEGTTNSGNHKVWVDPENGYNVRKAIVERRGKEVYRLDGVEIEEIEGHFLMTRATRKRWGGLWGAGDRIDVQTSQVSRLRTSFSPDFEAMQAFRPDLVIPEGTKVHHLDMPREVRYEWRNGRVQRPTPIGDAAEVLESALNRAKERNRKVFVRVGAPWCKPCHALDDFLSKPTIANILEKDFVLVKLDLDLMTGAQEVVGNIRKPSEGQGIPWFAFLDASGTVLKTSTKPDGTNIGLPVDPKTEIPYFVKMLMDSRMNMSRNEIQLIEDELTDFGKTLAGQ